MNAALERAAAVGAVSKPIGTLSTGNALLQFAVKARAIPTVESAPKSLANNYMRSHIWTKSMVTTASALNSARHGQSKANTYHTNTLSHLTERVLHFAYYITYKSRHF